ncbi:unnamed protein product [Spodoptera exigua]|nr:unnamed protein product [Spodoptera exigua]
MKRRNAETGKLRRPLKRTKITEGMYGNSMLYLKFVMIWATVVMADYMLEFRFEFLWPFWMMLRSVYDSFKYQGLAFSVFFICIALTSDMICFFFIPLQYIFFAASTYVWVQYVWYTFADKGICVPTVAICCLLVYVEGLWRGSRAGAGELCRPLAAHCVGYPVVTLGFGAKALIAHRLRQRRQRHVRAMNEFYFQLMRDALPESALDQSQSQTQVAGKDGVANGGADCAQTVAQAQPTDARYANGSLRRCRYKTADHNGHCPPEHVSNKVDKIEKQVSHTNSVREKASHASNGSSHSSGSSHSTHSSGGGALSNGSACHAAPDDDDRHDHSKGGSKSSKAEKEKKEASTLKEEKRKNKNRDKDKDSIDSHKSTEHTKEQIVKDKEVESTKDCVKIKESSNKEAKEKEKERDRERERETRERDKEREREREREQREARECMEELKRVRAELAAARTAEADARRALAAAVAAERQRRADHAQLKQAHAALQHKVNAWRTGERAALERRLADERRARTNAENQLLRARHQPRTPNGECESESCRSRRAAAEAESALLRRELRAARERAAALSRGAVGGGVGGVGGVGGAAGAFDSAAERLHHLEHSLSAETRVKLDLLSALGEAKRKLSIQDGLISRQEKEIEELKAQMLAVMPTEFVAPSSAAVSKLRLSDGSPLDPNASVYTPKQLAQCSDA